MSQRATCTVANAWLPCLRYSNHVCLMHETIQGALVWLRKEGWSKEEFKQHMVSFKDAFPNLAVTINSELVAKMCDHLLAEMALVHRLVPHQLVLR